MSAPAPPASLPDEGAAAVSAARDLPGTFPLYGLAGNTDEQQPTAALSPASSSRSSSSLSTCSSLSFLRAAAEPAEQTSVAAAETTAVVAEAPVETASRIAGADATPELPAIVTAAAAAEQVTIAATSSCSSPMQSGDLPVSAAGAQLAPLHTDLPTCLNAAGSSWLHSAQPAEHLTAAVGAAVGAVAADTIDGSPGSSTSPARSGDSTPEQNPMGSSPNRAPPTQRFAVAAIGATTDCSSLTSHVEAAPADPIIGGAEPLAFSDGDGHSTAAVRAAFVADASAGVASTGGPAACSRIDNPGSGSVTATCAGDDTAAQDLGACPGKCGMRARAGGVDVRRAVAVAARVGE